ncbi:uncharacterized protein LOC131175494 [Hevea brasiliensis]|uniref:uncharacterized protein LOC131175494 n=1 Tax=Hevea brasiliensis TaxID=3981 RepID=UPI0025D1A5FA|nr:uncharacterized protein LOC131175494 [Hevea brasiliensis]
MGFKFTQLCSKILQENVRKAYGHHVRVFSTNCGEFEARTGRQGHKQVVKLNDQTYYCGKFQEMRISCSHVIAICQSKVIDYGQYVSDYYKLERALKCYELMFHAHGDEAYWLESNGDPLVPDSTRKRQKGRPMSSRRMSEMDWMLKGKLGKRSTIYCSICLEP